MGRRGKRSGKKVVIKRTIRKWSRWNPHPKFGDARVRQHWDVKHSPTVNLARLGLLALPNDLTGHQTRERVLATSASTAQQERAEQDSHKTVTELFDLPTVPPPNFRSRCPLKLEEQRYIAKCMTKHGKDYLAMFRDIKTNDMQRTEPQLRKLGSTFLMLTDEQRQVPVPENVQHLMLQPEQEECLNSKE